MGSQVRRLLVIALTALAASLAGCSRRPPAKDYPLQGQILAVNMDRQELTISHGDIAGLMPGMTMTYPVANRALMQGRTPGELISGTLEVQDSAGKLVAITHTGSAPLPDTNTAALAAGVLAEGDSVPDAAFIDQADRRRSFSEWHGTVTLLTFIYTNCPMPTFCPLMDQNFETIQRAAAEDPLLKGRIQLISMTFDPERDTPAVLAQHAALRHADPAVWTFLTGDAVTINRFVARFGVSTIRPENAQDITHNLRTVLIGRDGKIVKIYTGNDWTPGTVLADMRAALGAA
jgi:protein SCO1/2